MRVKFHPPAKGSCYGNIIWKGAYPMRGWKFPKTHPCADNPEPMVFSFKGQPKSDDALGKFRALGYYASCFPEGDGISFAPEEEKTSEQMIEDIQSCFGFEVMPWSAQL